VLPTPGRADEFPILVEGFASVDPAKTASCATRALWSLRWKLGDLFGLDDPGSGLGSRVTTRCGGQQVEEHARDLGRWRWVVERVFAWLHNFRRLRTRWERDPIMHIAFLTLGCAVICWRYPADEFSPSAPSAFTAGTARASQLTPHDGPWSSRGIAGVPTHALQPRFDHLQTCADLIELRR